MNTYHRYRPTDEGLATEIHVVLQLLANAHATLDRMGAPKAHETASAGSCYDDDDSEVSV